MNLENKILLLFVQTYQKKEIASKYGIVTWPWQKKGEPQYKETSCDKDEKNA